MTTHIQLCLWAFVVLWKNNTISRLDRLRLWRKTLNLYLCFLAFADPARPYWQLRGAMRAAFLSALYDYETDWVPIANDSRSRYLELLRRHVNDSDAVRIGSELFTLDREKRLSKDGLERGSLALAFYRNVIGSEWLKQYSEEEIASYGRALQQVDDLLDFEEDTRSGNKNCFLTAECGWHVADVRSFLQSEFFQRLEAHSIVYHRLKEECYRLLNEPKNKGLGTKELLMLTRPHTGLFALVLTVIGFKLLDLPLFVGVLYGLGFAGVALSIMVFNDLLDRQRDWAKNKQVAFRHPLLVLSLWRRLSVYTLAVFAVEAVFFSLPVAMWCGAVWLLGLLYSVVKLPYPLNNALVAFCAGTPVLTGMVYAGIVVLKPILVFYIVFATIVVTEAIKDIQDREGDAGHKDTLAVKIGRIPATIAAIGLCVLPVIATLFYPHLIVKATATIFALIVFMLGVSFTRPHALYQAERMADVFLGMLCIALFVV